MTTPRFTCPVSDVTLPPSLPGVLAEVIRMREMRLAELHVFAEELSAEHGPVTEDERRALRDEWP